MNSKEFKISTIEFNGYQDQPVGNRYFRLNQESKTLGLIFPGLYYSCDMPLLYYTAQLLLSRIVDILQVWPNYTVPSFQSLDQVERSNWLQADALAAMEAGLRQRKYRQTILVGKSLGTISMALLIGKQMLMEDIVTIWLTPLLHIPEVSSRLLSLQSPALYISGDKDPTYNEGIFRQIKDLHKAKVIIIEGANHSLEIPGNPLLSLQILETVTRQIGGFLDLPAVKLAK